VSSVTDLGGGFYSALFTGPSTSSEITYSIGVSVEKSGYVMNSTSVSVVVKPSAVPSVVPIDLIAIIIIAAIALITVVGVAIVFFRKKK